MDLLSYEIKESARAKHVRLKVSLYDASLVVVVPTGFDRECIPEVLQEKRHWIERTQRDVMAQRRLVSAKPLEVRPQRIHLRAVEEEWSVDYRPALSPSVAIAENGGHTLLLQGNVHSALACREALGGWVRGRAQQYLVPWLGVLSQAQGLSVGRVMVKAQRTCWATCSTRRTVSISRKLIFIPAHLVEYVFIHELCHTVQMNHSGEFWELVGQRAPDYKALEVELRTAWRYVPVWLGVNGSSH